MASYLLPAILDQQEQMYCSCHSYSFAFANAVNAGAVVVVATKVKLWGQTVAYVRDLDRILVEVASLL